MALIKAIECGPRFCFHLVHTPGDSRGMLGGSAFGESTLVLAN